MTAAVLHRGSRSCLSEVQRLRAELDATRADRDRLAELVARHLAADPLERLAEQWAVYALESYKAGRADVLAELDATWPTYPKLPDLSGPELAELEALRWAVRGQPRTREQFGQPHPADRTGQDPT